MSPIGGLNFASLKMTSIYGKTNHVTTGLQDAKGGRVGNVEIFQVSIPRATLVLLSDVNCLIYS